MPDVGSAIVTRLEASPLFVAAVGDRADWTTSPQGTPYPRVVLTFITRDRPDHYTGPDMCNTRLQLDVYSDVSAGEAAAIAELAIDALQPAATVGGVRFERAVEVDGPTDSGEQTDTLYAYRARTDFALMHANEGV